MLASIKKREVPGFLNDDLSAIIKLRKKHQAEDHSRVIKDAPQWVIYPGSNCPDGKACAVGIADSDPQGVATQLQKALDRAALSAASQIESNLSVVLEDTNLSLAKPFEIMTASLVRQRYAHTLKDVWMNERGTLFVRVAADPSQSIQPCTFFLRL